MLFCAGLASANQDSLLLALSEAENDQQRMFTMINLSSELLTEDPIAALDYIEQALAYSYELKSKRGEAYCYYNIGGVNYHQKRYDIAIENYLKALPLLNDLAIESGLYNARKYIARCYDGLGDYKNSLTYYQLYLDDAKSKTDRSDWIQAVKSIARMHYNLKDYAASKTWLNLALDYYTLLDNKEEIFEINEKLGDVELAQNETGQALVYYSQNTEIANSIGDNRRASRNYSNIGKVYGKKKNKKKQIEYEQQALNTSNDNGLKDLSTRNNLKIGMWLLEENNPPEAIAYLENTVNSADELGLLEEKKEALKNLTTAYNAVGDTVKAQRNLFKYNQVLDSLKKLEQAENLTSVRLTSDLTKREQRIALLEKERQILDQQFKLLEKEKVVAAEKLQTQRYINYSLAIGFIILAISAVLVYRSSKQKRKANQLLALQSLRSQMNPHFIFNSLNSVNSFISKNDDRSANKYLSEFSRLMRAVMENSKFDFVPLSSEIEILDLYLKLEHFRFRDKFNYTFEVDESIEEDITGVPPMLIQPYIENSVWHGLRYKEEMGTLKVSFKQHKGQLQAVIEDDGIGRKKSQELKTKNQKESKSTGMKNIEERLRILNELHGTSLKVTVEDVLVDGVCKGTRVEINIPHQKIDDSAT